MTTLTPPMTTVAGPSPTAPLRPSRRHVWGVLAAQLASGGGRAAWQGASGAAESWQFATGPADLDIWCDDSAYARLDALLTGMGAARVQNADDARRLRHTSYALETADGLAVVDLTRGDLRVGPVLMVANADVRTNLHGDGVARLAGTSGAADLFIRPLLRGRIVEGSRLAEARARWAAAPAADRATLVSALGRQLDAAIAQDISRTLDGGTPEPSLVPRTRRAFLRASLRPANLASTWRQRHTILPARGRAGVLGLSTKGSLVVLVGTDGSGKSTVAAEIDSRLVACGIPTTSVYMGMARGNLPGVGLARRLLGVAPAGDSAPKAERPVPASAPSPASRDHALVRRAAAWFYALEYGYRWWRDIRPGLRHGGVVISDRYVYDLRESPWPGSLASRVAERLMPRPDVLVLPDAPDALIHGRKPERPAIEQADQQGRFRALVEQAPAGTAALRVDTSGRLPGDHVAPVVAAVVASLHRQH